MAIKRDWMRVPNLKFRTKLSRLNECLVSVVDKRRKLIHFSGIDTSNGDYARSECISTQYMDILDESIKIFCIIRYNVHTDHNRFSLPKSNSLQKRIACEVPYEANSTSNAVD